MSDPEHPWRNAVTAHGYAADEIISALQKEIRRGNVENAVLIACEMIATSSELEEMLWRRLCVISVEDVGFGELQAPVLVESLHAMAHRFGREEGDRGLFAIHAVRYLAGCQKDRGSDEMYSWARHGLAVGELRPEIPDYALDMHTVSGRAMGRGKLHFLTEGALVSPERHHRDTTYLERLLDGLREE